MLKYLRLQNFKNHRDSTFDRLGKVTALVGPNGAGKSSVLEALHYLHQISRNSVDALFRGPRSGHLLTRADQPGLSLELRAQNEIGWKVRLDFKKVFESPDGPFKLNWYYNAPKKSSGLGGSESSLLDLRAPSELIDALSRAVYLRLDAGNVSRPSYSEADVPRVEFDGRGVATVCAYHLTYDKHRAEAVLDAVRAVVPGVKDIRVRPANVVRKRERIIQVDDRSVVINDDQTLRGHELIFDMISGDAIPAHAVSHGTLLCTALLTALHSEHVPHLVLLDDIETALHPQAQRELMEVLKHLSSDRQIVISTHSPYIVDQLDPSDVWAIGLDSEGCAQPRRLSDHPDAEEAMRLLTTGEMWSAYGEQWDESATASSGS